MSQFPGDDETVVADHGLPCGPHSPLAVGGQGNIADAGVAATEGPLGLAVADYEDARSCHGEAVDEVAGC